MEELAKADDRYKKAMEELAKANSGDTVKTLTNKLANTKEEYGEMARTLITAAKNFPE